MLKLKLIHVSKRDPREAKQNGHHFADNIPKCIFFNKYFFIFFYYNLPGFKGSY